LKRLLRTTDNSRHFTLLCDPQFLFNDEGKPLFAAERAKVRQPLGWLLGDNLQAAAASFHCGDLFYFELRMLGSLDTEPYKLAEELRTRMKEMPAAIESYIDAIVPPHYWSKLARRYPLMIGQLDEQMRIGVENEQAIVNSVLPPSAGHNLFLGGELLVSTAPGQAIVLAATAAPTAAAPKTIADALQLKTSYNFDQQSLEFAMRDLAEDVKGNLKNAPFEFGIKILGDDLKLDGITRNQSIRDFKQENQTVADILTALVRKANPVTTVKDPSEKDQKLVWVIGPDPENPGKQIVLITTRTAATTKKYTLPALFVPK
jgi:eukaryotic-like serine/threonine-protein kinase